MTPENGSTPEEQERLEGWKTIAAYLDISPRRAQEWRDDEKLPIFSESESPKARVFAYKSELDAWRRNRQVAANRPLAAPAFSPPLEQAPSPVAPRQQNRNPVLLVFAALIILFSLTYYLATRPSGPVPPSLAHTPRRHFSLSTAEGSPVHRIPLPEQPSLVAVSPDGNSFATSCLKKHCLMLADRLSAKVRTIPLPFEPAALEYMPDGKSLLVGSLTEGLVTVFHNGTLSEKVIPTGGPISDIAIAPDAKRAYFAMISSGVKRLDLTTGEWRTISRHACPYHLDLSVATNQLLVSYQCGGPTGRDGHDAIELYDLATESVRSVFSGPPLVGGAHRFSPDGKLVFLDGMDACLKGVYDNLGCPTVPSLIYHLFRPSDNRLIQPIAIEPVGPGKVHWTADGNYVVITSKRVVDVRTLQITEKTPADFPGPVDTAFTSDASRIVITTDGLSRSIFWYDSEDESCTLPLDGLAHYFPLDGAGFDAVSNDHLTAADGATYLPGFRGQALSLAEFGKKQAARSSSDYHFGNRGTSLVFYLKPQAPSTQTTILESTEEPRNSGWRLSLGPLGELDLQLRSNGIVGITRVIGNRLLPLEKWSQIAITISQDEIRMYIDGTLAASKELGTPPPIIDLLTETPLRFGHSAASPDRFKGLIDEVAFFRRVVPAQEIAQMHRTQSSPKCRWGR